MNLNRITFLTIVSLLVLTGLACGPGFLAGRPEPTATPTKTPKPPPTVTPDAAVATTTPVPTPTEVPPPTDTPAPTETAAPTEAPPATDTPAPDLPTPTETPVPEEPTATPVPVEPTPLPEPTETPAAEVAYRIVHYKVLGENENNGGIFNPGGMHMIFLTVLDANGNGLDGAIVKDANGSALEVVTGDKGPGKAEIQMEYEPYRLFVAADPGGPTTSDVSNQMNTLYPHIPDIIGKLGSIDNEYSVCPTPEVRCTPPFYNVHFSYEITFQKVK
jgi:hypothetical protein